MSHLRTAALLSLAALGCTVAVAPAGAQTTITVDTADPNNPTNIPFGTAGDYSRGGAAEYQQLYSGSAFSGPVSIDMISFSSSSDVGNKVEAVNYDITVFLSNTTATTGSLSTLSSDFSANIGTNQTMVYSNVLPAALTASNTFDLNIPVLLNPFVFNSSSPAGPNLLLDIYINADNGTNRFEFFQGTSAASTLTESVFYSDYPANANPVVAQGGLLTRFTVTPAPRTVVSCCFDPRSGRHSRPHRPPKPPSLAGLTAPNVRPPPAGCFARPQALWRQETLKADHKRMLSCRLPGPALAILPGGAILVDKCRQNFYTESITFLLYVEAEWLTM